MVAGEKTKKRNKAKKTSTVRDTMKGAKLLLFQFCTNILYIM